MVEAKSKKDTLKARAKTAQTSRQIADMVQVRAHLFFWNGMQDCPHTRTWLGSSVQENKAIAHEPISHALGLSD